MNEPEVEVFATVDELNEFAANEFARLADESIRARGRFAVALSGGSTPKKLYSLLAENFQSRIDWRKTHFFFGDERLVASDSEESNFRMANEALFSKIKVPKKNIHRYSTEKAVEFMNDNYRGCGFGRLIFIGRQTMLTAERMEKEIRRVFDLKENEFPRFDLILLGMGADGHTASLFPETDALEETTRLVVANRVVKLETFRLTFTVPTINNARSIIFLIAGADKAEALREVLKGERNPQKFPAQFIRSENGKLLFLTDEKAARLL